MKHSPLFPHTKQLQQGWRYLLFEAVFLPRLLITALSLLHISVSNATLNFLCFGINGAAVLILFRTFFCSTLQDSARNWLKILITAAAGLAVYETASILLNLLILWIDPSFANIGNGSIAAMAEENFPLSVFCTVLLVPITEEVLHRGVVFGGVYRRSPAAAYVVSTLIFSLVHIDGYIGLADPPVLLLCFLQYLPAGVCLAAAYQVSGSIIAPILIHCAANGIAIFAMR